MAKLTKAERSAAAKKAAKTRAENKAAEEERDEETPRDSVTAREKASEPQAVHESQQGLERRAEPKPVNVEGNRFHEVGERAEKRLTRKA